MFVRLPTGSRAPFQVFVDGVAQREGEDFAIEADRIVFHRRLRVPRERFWHRAVQTLAGVGIYNQGDSVDVHYRTVEGHEAVATQVTLEIDPSRAGA